MSMGRMGVSVVAASLAAVCLSPSARARDEAAPSHGTTGIPCRVSWRGSTYGGDTQRSVGEATMTRIVPRAGGAFLAMGSGRATVEYTSALGCPMEGTPWTATYDVIITSEDGHTATVTLASMDPPHSVVACPATGHMQFDADVPEFEATVVLRPGEQDFDQEFQLTGPERQTGVHLPDRTVAGDMGTVTLHYCTLR
jgi:hypothetical protein